MNDNLYTILSKSSFFENETGFSHSLYDTGNAESTSLKKKVMCLA
jgi:hypothetical protein